MIIEIEERLRATVTDMFGNKHPAELKNGSISLELTSSPIYLEGVDHIVDVTPGDPIHEFSSEDHTTLAGFEDLSNWEVDPKPVKELEALKESVPVVMSKFQFSVVARYNGKGPLLRIGLKDESSPPLEIPYARMIHSGKNIHVPESARTIGTWIHGNSS